MNTETGKIMMLDDVQKLPPAEQAKFIEVKRGLTAFEKEKMQIHLYSLCGCGSGKKFKFCCHKP